MILHLCFRKKCSNLTAYVRIWWQLCVALPFLFLAYSWLSFYMSYDFDELVLSYVFLIKRCYLNKLNYGKKWWYWYKTNKVFDLIFFLFLLKTENKKKKNSNKIQSLCMTTIILEKFVKWKNSGCEMRSNGEMKAVTWRGKWFIWKNACREDTKCTILVRFVFCVKFLCI